MLGLCGAESGHVGVVVLQCGRAAGRRLPLPCTSIPPSPSLSPPHSYDCTRCPMTTSPSSCRGASLVSWPFVTLVGLLSRH